MSVIQLNERSAFPGCWCCACACLRVCVIIRLRQGWWSACVIVKRVCVSLGVCWQGGWLGTGPCWLGNCSDTESDATRENRQVLCTRSSESRPWDTLPQHRHHYEARRTHHAHVYTHVPVCIRALLFVHTHILQCINTHKYTDLSIHPHVHAVHRPANTHACTHTQTEA